MNMNYIPFLALFLMAILLGKGEEEMRGLFHPFLYKIPTLSKTHSRLSFKYKTLSQAIDEILLNTEKLIVTTNNFCIKGMQLFITIK